MDRDRGKVVIIIQARMESTRLPGKVLRNVLGKPLLSYLLERVLRVNNAELVVVATTEKEEDDKIFQFCRENGVSVFRGDEEDVLERYLQTAKFYQADTIVRITADCPLIDPCVIENVIQYYLENEFDYVGNTLSLTFPRGMDTEVFSREALETAALQAKEKSEREHVTLFMYKHPEMFKLANVPYKINKSEYRLTVDTEEDFQLIKLILQKLYPINPEFSLEDIIKMLDANPELPQMNTNVVQKSIEES